MKRGDWVRVWDDDKDDAIETRYLAHIEGAIEPYVVVDRFDGGLDDFEAGKPFFFFAWKHAEPIEDNREGKEPWQPKVGDRVKLVKVDPMWGGEDRSNPVWGSKYGQVGGSIIDAKRDGTFIVMWDNFTRNSCYTTDHLQPL